MLIFSFAISASIISCWSSRRSSSVFVDSKKSSLDCIQQAEVRLEQQVVSTSPIVDDEEDDEDEIVREVERYPKRENFLIKV